MEESEMMVALVELGNWRRQEMYGSSLICRKKWRMKNVKKLREKRKEMI